MPSLSHTDLCKIAAKHKLVMSDEEVEVALEIVRQISVSLQNVERLNERLGPPAGRPVTGRRPERWENRLGGWSWLCSIKERDGGPLAGMRVAVKDNISVAGVPLLNGSPLMVGYIPARDATVVRRVLEAGGEIYGKATCENMCTSSGSHTSYPWPVLNPHDPEYMAGGSSSGCAALVASGDVDASIGGDQAGSIRIPSSWCGVYGLKPTYGLVPYTGAFPMEPTLDHLGPIARTAERLALLLEVIAGRDGMDQRQINTPHTLPSYTSALENASVRGLRIGVLVDGFGWDGVSEPDVDEVVMAGVERLGELGASVGEISVPLHRHGVDIWAIVLTQGVYAMMMRDGCVGRYLLGYYDVALQDFYSHVQSRLSDSLPPLLKAILLVGGHLEALANVRYYAMAQNLRQTLRQFYDDALARYDVLALPTTPKSPKKLGANNVREVVGLALMNVENTCPFNLTGHPAINVPCGKVDGLPVGMMLVGRHFAEGTLLKAARAWEIG
ncbi:MAG: amidase [Nitrososphaerota archaeon]